MIVSFLMLLNLHMKLQLVYASFPREDNRAVHNWHSNVKSPHEDGHSWYNTNGTQHDNHKHDK